MELDSVPFIVRLSRLRIESPASLIYYDLILERRAVLIIKTDSRVDTRLLAMNGVESTLNLKSLVSIARNLQTVRGF